MALFEGIDWAKAIGSLANPLQQVGATMLENSGPSFSPVNRFAGLGDALNRGLLMNHEEDKQRRAEAERQKAIEQLRVTAPDLAMAVESGTSPQEAFQTLFDRQQDELEYQREQNDPYRQAQLQEARLGIEKSQWELDELQGADAEREANAVWLEDPEGGNRPDLAEMLRRNLIDYEDAAEELTGGATSDRNISTQPQWFVDPETNETVLGQLADDGTLVRTETDGLKPLAPFDISQQRAAGTQSGRTQAEAGAALPQAVADAQRISLQIADLKAHPGLDEIFGKTLGIIPNQWGPTVPGTNKANAMVRIEQMSGNAFLTGRELLKGGGAITDFESRKAEAAFARLSIAQSKEEFLLALDEFQAALDAGVAKLQQQSGAVPTSSSYATNPQTGERVMWNGQAWVPAQ